MLKIPSTQSQIVPGIRVLVVDDSVVMRKILSDALRDAPGLEVVGTASNGVIALHRIPQLSPDMVTLDIEMPELDGIATLREIKNRYPRIRVIMCSSFTERGASITVEALSLGADDYITKSARLPGENPIDTLRNQLLPKIRQLFPGHSGSARAGRGPQPGRDSPAHPAATESALREFLRSAQVARAPHQRARNSPIPPDRSESVVREFLKSAQAAQERHQRARNSPIPPDRSESVVREFLRSAQAAQERHQRARNSPIPSDRSESVVREFLRSGSDGSETYPAQSTPAVPRRVTRPQALAIGVSTGGPNALAELIPMLPRDFPLPVFIVQHMPPMFTRLLAERLRSLSNVNVMEAQDGMVATAGNVYIAPGDFHMGVVKRGNAVQLRLNQDPMENSCRPAVDVLFRSMAGVYGGATIAVILTGMGQDGLRGVEQLRALGGYVIAQDEASSVVWGMPGHVVRAGFADSVCDLKSVAPEIIRHL